MTPFDRSVLNLSGFLSWLSRRKAARAIASHFPQRTRARLWAASYDMFEDSAEQFYAEVYLKHILDTIQVGRKLRVLDLGCGHGRFAIPIAALGHEVTAFDANEVALARAREHAEQQGVSVDFRLADFWLEKFGTYDVLLAIESLNGTLDELERFLPFAFGHLDNGGLMILAVRTQYYQAATLLKARDYDGALRVTTDTAKTRWLEPHELRATLLSAGYEVLDTVGIGVISGLEFDPLGFLANPAKLTANEKHVLEQIELKFGSQNEVAGCARYILAIAKKTGG